jgi:hypothetical protein
MAVDLAAKNILRCKFTPHFWPIYRKPVNCCTTARKPDRTSKRTPHNSVRVFALKGRDTCLGQTELYGDTGLMPRWGICYDEGTTHSAGLIVIPNVKRIVMRCTPTTRFWSHIEVWCYSIAFAIETMMDMLSEKLG